MGLKTAEANQESVFLDPAKRRWSIIKRMAVGFILLVVFVSTIFIESLAKNPVFPELQLNDTDTAQNKIEPINESLIDRELESQLSRTKAKNAPENLGKLTDKQLSAKQEIYAFYVNWDENSKLSFQKHKETITTLVPEWLQLTSELRLKTTIDKSIVEEAKKNNIKILPLVNNVVDNKWDGDTLHRLFTVPGAEEEFIKNMMRYVKRNEFDGINIDFEEVHPKDRDEFSQFMDKLYNVFHPKGLMVTVDVPPDNPSFDYSSLAKRSDRVFVMLYDRHHAESSPGPIAPQKWAKESLSQLKIPSEKLIVSLGNYGYNWKEGSKQPAEPIAFSEIMELGSHSNLQIHWNSKAGNPYLRYKQGNNNHTVWFLDAATFYNQMRLAIDSGSRGIALWRLGSEDPSIWNFLNNPEQMQNPSAALKTLTDNKQDIAIGTGEILKVSKAESGNRKIEQDTNGLIHSVDYAKLPKPFKVTQYGKPASKKIVLSFDDGPDPAYTSQILDILKKNNIKGTFFIVGENALKHQGLVKRMHDEGHEIGSHTFTHPDVTSISPFQMKMELNLNQRLFQQITGHSMTLFRPTYDADTVLKKKGEQQAALEAQKLGYTMVGESIDSDDWRTLSSTEIVKEVMKQLPEGNIILMHDAGGDRSSTVEALPLVIKELKDRGYSFTTVGELLGKSNEEIMPPVDESNPYLVYNKAVFTIMQGWKKGLTVLFYSVILLGIIRLTLFLFLSRKQIKRAEKKPLDPDFTPFVSVVIAAYNEEKVICKTVDSILASNYPCFEVLVIDDGSKDRTADLVQKTYGSNRLVRLIKKDNGGKSSAVNLGFKEARGEIVVALDADTLIAENAISLLVSHFTDNLVAAVSGNVKVGNKGNLLTKWQHIEYVTGFNLERRAFAALNCITVVPGAIGAWRKSAVAEAGYFKEDTLAEDTDLTLTLLRNGKKIEFEEKAYAFTEVPEDVKSLAKQRYRWVYGTLQCLWKHRDALFNTKHHSLGYIALPNMWIFQYFYQLVAPIADLLFIMALFTPHPERAVIGFILFYLLDFLAALYAFSLEKESPKPLISLFLQRILYKQIMTYVVIKSIFSAIKGVTVGWGKLNRNGNAIQSTNRDGSSLPG
ncbi:transposase [Bacillus sp. FJAT-27225]|uniref:polysaccharide deacetylase family protein n=1 Tax=Bacillus sp. FJAT-27225 TaxID=1743144 RepID=UPI00080C24E2|nr:transposase [Bacillus sp. FJAT-27225]